MEVYVHVFHPATCPSIFFYSTYILSSVLPEQLLAVLMLRQRTPCVHPTLCTLNPTANYLFPGHASEGRQEAERSLAWPHLQQTGSWRKNKNAARAASCFFYKKVKFQQIPKTFNHTQWFIFPTGSRIKWCVDNNHTSILQHDTWQSADVLTGAHTSISLGQLAALL